MDEKVFEWEQAKQVIAYVNETYGDKLEFLWKNFENAIWRNRKNRKWYGLLMKIPAVKLGIESDEIVEIIDLRFEPGEARELARSTTGIYPGYHMNKNNWITVILDGSVALEQIETLIDQSYEISLGRKKLL